MCRAGRFVDGEIAIWAMWNHLLTRLKVKLDAIETDRDEGRLKRHKVGDAADFSIGIRIEPCRQTRFTNVVIATEPFGWAERSAVSLE